jgi:hypothetical protein
MAMSGWTWTSLTEDQMRIVRVAEQTLGVGYLLVYKPAEWPDGSSGERRLLGLQVAPLTHTQLEYLHELESQLQSTVVAYVDAH